MFRLLKRTAETAIRLPFSMAWDLISLGNMGGISSTQKVLREHNSKKQLDDFVEIINRLNSIQK